MTMSLFLTAFSGFFAIMNPFVNLPIFLSMTTGMDAAKQRKQALKIGLNCLIMTVVIAGSGMAILDFFGIGLQDFRIAGGIVLMGIALSMLHGKENTSHSGTEKEKEHIEPRQDGQDISFYPMTFPMIVGPGTIATLILMMGHAHDNADYVAVGVALAAVLVMLTVVLYLAPVIGHHMSGTMRIVMTRLMGMVLAAIAVQMVVAGVKSLFPGLAA